MKKTSIFLIAVFLVLLAVSPAVAVSDLPFVVDNGDILMPEEELLLQETAMQLSDAYGMDIVILTEDSLGGQRAQIFADDFYDGQGYAEDGILILLSMAEREWYISACGNVIFVATDYAVQQLGESALPHFSSGDYFSGFQAYLDQLAILMDAYEAGSPMDGYADTSNGYYHGDQEEVIYYEEEQGVNWLLSLGIGAAVAGVSTFAMISSMNTKKSQRGAAGYISAGSFRLHKHRDLFLYSNVKKVRRQQSQSSSGGGSSVHRSSSGRRHSGGGGRF